MLKKSNADVVIKDTDSKAEALKQKILDESDKEIFAVRKFYISNSGNDTNDGTAPETAWKTINRLNTAKLSAGDAVFFERGGLWRGEILCRTGVTYAAYGNGVKPCIYGSPEDGAGSEKWILTNAEKNIWKFHKKLYDVGCIVFNHGEEHGIKALPDYINGKYYVRDEKNIEYKTEFNINVNLDKELMFFSECSAVKYPNGNISIADGKNVGDLFLKCDKGNPGTVFNSIEFLTRPNIFAICDNSNVTIHNFCLKYCGGHAVGGYNCMNTTVSGCEIGWIGGSIQSYNTSGRPIRYGNGIEIAANCCNYIAEYNWLYQIYDAGITYQAGKSDVQIVDYGVRFSDNLVEYCTYGIEYFLGSNRQTDVKNFQRDIEFKNNIIRYSGFGFGEQRPDKKTSAAIKTWPTSENCAESFTVTNNIFDRSRYCLISLFAAKPEWLPQYENNIIIQTEGTEAYLCAYKAGGGMIMLYTNEIANPELEKYFKLLGSDIYLTEKDWLYDLPEE